MDIKMSVGARAIRNILTFLIKMLPWHTCPLIKTETTSLYLYHTVSIWITVVPPQPNKATFNFSKLRP